MAFPCDGVAWPPSFLTSRAMPLIQIRKLFQSKQLFKRSPFNAQADGLKCFILQYFCSSPL